MASRSKSPVKLEPIPTTSINIYYRNHRGETRWRRIEFERFEYGSTEHHPEPGTLFLYAYDMEKADYRHFKVSDILLWDCEYGFISNPE